MEIIISGTNEEHLKRVKELAIKLGLSISHSTVKTDEPDQKDKRERALQALKELQEIGAFEEIKDPVAWQREMREDKPLYGREK